MSRKSRIMSTQKENFLKDIRDEELHVVDFMKLWFEFDEDKSGFLETSEIKKLLHSLLEKKGKAEKVESYYQKIMENFDINHDGKIELREFSLILPVEHNYLEQFSADGASEVKEYTQVFKHYDRDNNNYIEGSELISFLRDLRKTQDEEPDIADLETYKKFILNICDKDNDGRVSLDELKFLLVG